MGFRNHDPDAVLVFRVDSRSPLSSHSPHGIRLDDADRLSVEHYYPAMKSRTPRFS